MGTLSACYLRVASEDALRRLGLHDDGRGVEVEAGLRFVALDFGREVEPPVTFLRRASEATSSDALWLSFQSAVDAFAFQHWRAGRCLRELAYGIEVEREWERASGAPEVWEADVFFSARGLDDALSSGLLAADELLERWARRELVAGEGLPIIEARECARAVALYYGLPGWDATADERSPWYLAGE